MSRDYNRGRDNNNNNNQALVDARGIPVVQISTPSPKNSANRFRPIRIDPNALNDEVRICRTSSSSSASLNSAVAINNDKHSLINVYDSSQSKRNSATRLFYRGLTTATATSTVAPPPTTATSSINNNNSSSNSALVKKRRKRIDPPDDRQRKRRSSSSTTINNHNNSKSTPAILKGQSTTLPSSLPSLNNHNNNSIDEDSQKTLYSSQEEPETPLSKVNGHDQLNGTDKMPIDSKEEKGQDTLLYHPTRSKVESTDTMAQDHIEKVIGQQKDEKMDVNEEDKPCTTKQTEPMNKEKKRSADDLEEKCNIKGHTQPLINGIEPFSNKGEQINDKSNQEVKHTAMYEEKQHVDKIQNMQEDNGMKNDIVGETNDDSKQLQQQLLDEGKKKLDEEKKKAEEARKRTYEEKKRAEEEKVKADIDELNSKVKNLSEYYNIIRKIGEGIFFLLSFTTTDIFCMNNGPNNIYVLSLKKGTFSTVYEAIDLRSHLYSNESWQQQLLAGHRVTNPNANYEPSNRVALKRVYSTSSPARLASEVQILHELQGCPCIAPLIAAFRYQDEFFVVMPYIHSDDFKVNNKRCPVYC